jgi:hypothetical protein
MTCRSEEGSGAHVLPCPPLPCPPPPEPPLPPPPEECPPKGDDDGDGVDGDGDGVADGGRGGGVGAGRGGVGAAGAAVGGIAGRGGGAIWGRGGGGGAAGRAIGGAGRAIAGGAVGRGGIGGGAAGFAMAGFGAGFGAAAGFAAAVFLRAFTAGLRFAADLRADDALRAADLRAGFRFAIFFRAEALADFGLREAAARFVFLGFLDLVAFAMIDLPVLLATLFKRIGIPSGSAPLFLIRSEPLRHGNYHLKHTNLFFYVIAALASGVITEKSRSAKPVGAGPPVAQSTSSTGCRTGIGVPAAIWVMHPTLPAATTSGFRRSILASLRARNRSASAGCSML